MLSSNDIRGHFFLVPGFDENGFSGSPFGIIFVGLSYKSHLFKCLFRVLTRISVIFYQVPFQNVLK